MENKTISEYALEVICTRLDKINHRLVIVLIITIILLFVSNAAWLYAWMQYDYESENTTTETVYTQDGQGTNIIGDRNEVGHVAEQEHKNDNPQTEADEEQFKGDEEA